MKKELLNTFNNLALFIFDENEYNKIIKYLNIEEYHSVRLIISDKMVELELKIYLEDDNNVSILQYEKCNEIEDIVMELIIMNEGVKKREQI